MFDSNDIITTDKYRNEFSNLYFKTDCIKYNHPIQFRNILQHPPLKNQDCIITGHSDYDITDSDVSNYTPRMWCTVNKNTENPGVFGLPLGITNDCDDSEIHRIYGNIDCMIQVMNEPKIDKNMVYMNFNISNYPEERQCVYNLLKDYTWVTKGHINNSLEGRTIFLREIRNHTFVLCPRGNGIDTHRLWETLYMGSIPIVKKHTAHSGWIDLPICWIDDWNQISLDFLESEKKRIQSKNWDLSKLKISYWINIIRLNITAAISN
jgi:hypothetical protein